MTRTGGSQVKLDFGIYTMHWAFWGAFGLTRVILRRRDRNDSRPAATGPISQRETTAPYSRALLAFHGLAFAVMYLDRKSTRLNSSHSQISYAVFCLKKKKKQIETYTLSLLPGLLLCLPQLLV